MLSVTSWRSQSSVPGRRRPSPLAVSSGGAVVMLLAAAGTLPPLRCLFGVHEMEVVAGQNLVGKVERRMGRKNAIGIGKAPMKCLRHAAFDCALLSPIKPLQERQ